MRGKGDYEDKRKHKIIMQSHANVAYIKIESIYVYTEKRPEAIISRHYQWLSLGTEILSNL